jgi:uncharacterized membrane protein YfhO
LGITAASLLIILYFPYQNASQIIRGDIQGTIRNFIIIYTIILYFFMLRRYNHYLGLALILFVVFETGYFNYQTIKERDVLTNLDAKQKTGYNDYTVEAVKYLKSSDKQFYRINKSYTSGPAIHASLNDAKAQGFFGTRSYSSFNQKYYIRFLEEMKIIKKGNETMSRWSSGLTTRPLLQHIASTKYQLIRGIVKPPLNVLYDSVTMFGDVKVFRNKNFLPLGYTYDSIIRLSDFSKLSPLVKEVVIQKNCVVDDSITQLFGLFPSLLKADTTPNYTLQLLSADVLKRKSDTLTITRFTENQILGKIEPKSRKLLFFSIPYDRGWHGRIDGKEVNLLLCNIGFIGLVVDPGSNQIDLFYRQHYFYASLFVSIN